MSTIRLGIVSILIIILSLAVSAAPNPGHDGRQVSVDTTSIASAGCAANPNMLLQDAINAGCFSSGLGGTGAVNRMALWTGPSSLVASAIYQDANNNIGIGAPNPSNILELRRDDQNVGITFHDPGTAWYTIGLNGQKFKLIQGTDLSSGTIIFGISSANVGIGTDSPRQKLDVTGNVIATGDINAQNRLCIDGDCRSAWPGGVTGNGNANSIPLWTGATVIGNSIMTELGGNVGVNVASPNARLHVRNTLRVQNDGTNWPTIYMQNNANTFRTVVSSEGLLQTWNAPVGGALAHTVEANGRTVIGPRGSTPAAQQLDVRGNVEADGYCINGSCKTNWNEGIGSGQIQHGQTIPVPAGFNRANCHTIVMPRDIGDLQGLSAIDWIAAYADSSGKVTCTYSLEDDDQSHPDSCSYLIVCA